jgi:hypothetical protein
LKGFWEKRRILKSINALDLVPVIIVKFEKNNENKIKLLVPRFSINFFYQIFKGKHLSPDYKVSLDETGSCVWLLIDGNRTISEISVEIINNYKSGNFSLENIDERIIAFISKMYQEEYITFRQLL